MGRVVTVAASLMLLVASGCGGDTRESLVVEGMATMKEMVVALEGVKDAATAKAAKPKLQALIAKLNDLNARQSKLPAPTEAQMKPIIEKYGKEMDETQMKFTGAMMKIAFDPAIQAELQDLEQSMKTTIK